MEWGLAIGIGLMLLGALIIILGLRKTRIKTVKATRGSVAVGGDNSGPIVNVNTHAGSGGGHHGLTILGIVVEVIAILVTVWHAMHLAGQ